MDYPSLYRDGDGNDITNRVLEARHKAEEAVAEEVLKKRARTKKATDGKR